MRSEWRQKLVDWKKLKDLLFSPTNLDGEDEFVRKVMARIPVMERRSFGADWKQWFKIPVLVFASFMIVMFGPSSSEPNSHTESILLADEFGDLNEEEGDTVEDFSNDFVGFLGEEL